MRLQAQIVDRFYRLWFALLHYANTRLLIDPSFPDTANGNVLPESAVQIRDAIYADNTIITQFLSANPAQLSAPDLDIIASWQTRIHDTFIVLSSQQDYTIFLSQTEPVHVYGVLGLIDEIEDVLLTPLPTSVEAVLLPFENHIIYDSLLIQYSSQFEMYTLRNFRTQYRMLTEREGIITSLRPEDQRQGQREEIAVRNSKVLTAFRHALRATGQSVTMIESHCATISDFAESILLAADPPQSILTLTPANIVTYRLRHPDRKVVASFKLFNRFLFVTRRIDSGMVEDIYAALRNPD
jgi:hypothetical protein